MSHSVGKGRYEKRDRWDFECYLIAAIFTAYLVGVIWIGFRVPVPGTCFSCE
jgi:hypothetical protein